MRRTGWRSTPRSARSTKKPSSGLSRRKNLGYGLAKIKVGLGAIETEAARIAEISSRAPKLRLRLDANRAWTEDQAARFVACVANLPIDALEEPLACPTVESLRRLQRCASFPLAVDESLFELGPEALFAAAAVRRLVLKPARIGGYGRTLRLAERAADSGMDVVLTSVVDSAVGVMAAAQLAAALGGGAAHGLATSDWLACDVAVMPTIRNGRLELPDTPGLGLTPNGDFA